jgi:hypothetical protein
MELTFGAQVGVKAPSSNLHMAGAWEVPYWPNKIKQQRKRSNNGNTRRTTKARLAST